MARKIDNNATVLILTQEENTALNYLLHAFRGNPDFLAHLTEKYGFVFGDEGHREAITKLWDGLYRATNNVAP